MYGREVSVRMYDEIGMSEGHHPLSHHQNDPVKLEALTKINTFHMELFAYYLAKLKAAREGDDPAVDDRAHDGGDGAQQQAKRDGSKVGRNDPCPCGSGKKFKKCHGVNV